MDDEYIIEEFSDDEYNSSSSEDDLQYFIKKQCGLIDVKDDFEDEMDKVMTAHMQKINHSQTIVTNEAIPTSSTGDDKDSETAKQKENDDLLYDPNMDDDDEKWVTEKRRSYIFPSINNAKSNAKPLPNSDAVLNCPACLSLLCLDCQQHAVYKSQYRAMFVSNCKVMERETLKYPGNKKKNRKKSTQENNFEETYNPVRCSVCNTEVAVYDKEEVYHFFNVLASY